VLVEYKDSVYDFTSYMDKVEVYSSISEAVEAKQNLAMEVLQ
jgi:hypothetical protein